MTAKTKPQTKTRRGSGATPPGAERSRPRRPAERAAPKIVPPEPEIPDLGETTGNDFA